MHPLVRKALRLGLVFGLRQLFAGAGPRSGAALAPVARRVPDEVLAGERAPRPDELLGVSTRGVGRFADVDPLTMPGWQRRSGRLATLVGWGAVAGAIGRRRWQDGRADDAEAPARPDGVPSEAEPPRR